MWKKAIGVNKLSLVNLLFTMFVFNLAYVFQVQTENHIFEFLNFLNLWLKGLHPGRQGFLFAAYAHYQNNQTGQVCTNFQ